MTRTLVAGIGNVLMSDDAIGPYCVRQLVAQYSFPSGVAVEDLGTPGLDLALHLSDADVVILIDALHGAPGGKIGVFDFGELSGSGAGVRLDTHAPALAESIQVARLTSDRPRDVTLIGLGGENFDHGTALTPAVGALMPALIATVLKELATRGIAAVLRDAPSAPDVWWVQ